MSSPQIDQVLMSTGVSFLVGPEKNITTMGILVKCLAVGILFYIYKSMS